MVCDGMREFAIEFRFSEPSENISFRLEERSVGEPVS